MHSELMFHILAILTLYDLLCASTYKKARDNVWMLQFTCLLVTRGESTNGKYNSNVSPDIAPMSFPKKWRTGLYLCVQTVRSEADEALNGS